MRTDIFAYLSGPITACNGRSVEQHIATAVDAYLRLINAGVPTFCPHLSAAFPSAAAVDYETWMDYDFAMLSRCTHLVMLPHWEESAGCLREREYAICEREITVMNSADKMIAWCERDAAWKQELHALLNGKGA